MPWQADAERLCGQLSPEASAWLHESLARVREGEEALARRFSMAKRRLGQQGPAGRALLLGAALDALGTERHVPVVEQIYRTGELAERQALLSALPSLPDAARFVPLAVEAVRSNATSIVEAIACENPFPSRYFAPEAWNQMVLKCLFNGIALARVVGLAQRNTAELRRMVADYARERRLAGRPMPADAALVLDGGTDAAF